MSEKQSSCAVCGGAFSRSNRIYAKGSCENCWHIFKRKVSSSRVVVIENCSKGCIVRETERNACVTCFMDKCFAVGFQYQGVHSLNDLHTFILPKDNRCPVCKVDLHKRRSIQFGVISCRSCYFFFASMYRKLNANNLRLSKCNSSRRCKVRPETRSECRHCWLKKCFKVGFKADGFTNIKCLSNNLNQNVKVIDDTVCIPIATADDADRTLEPLIKKRPLTCEFPDSLMEVDKTIIDEQKVSMLSPDNDMLERQEPSACAVCEISTTKTAYGMNVCKKCHSFFHNKKRNIGGLTLCEQVCPINWKTKSFCTYCRLKKCMLSGMDFESNFSFMYFFFNILN